MIKEETVAVCPYAQRRQQKPKKLVELSIVGINEVIGMYIKQGICLPAVSLSISGSLKRHRAYPTFRYVCSLTGDTEFVMDLKTYLHTVVCTQNCEVFCLDRRNFDRLVARRNPSTLQLLRDGAEIKHLCRITRAHESKVALYIELPMGFLLT